MSPARETGTTTIRSVTARETRKSGPPAKESAGIEQGCRVGEAARVDPQEGKEERAGDKDHGGEREHDDGHARPGRAVR